MSQLKKKAIPYSQVMHIIEACPEQRTKLAIAIQYAFATRIGELAKEYIHYYYRNTDRFDKQVFVSEGPKNKHFAVKEVEQEISFLKPNFKQKKIKNTDKDIVGVDRFTSFVMRSGEPYLYDLILSWVRGKGYEEPIFDIKQSRLRFLVDAELKKYNVGWSTHWLRQSRAWHIGEATGDPYAVQAILGHGDLNTSLKYVSGLRTSLRKLFSGGKTMEELLGRVVK